MLGDRPVIGPYPWEPFPPGEPEPPGKDPAYVSAFRGAVSGADGYRLTRAALRIEGDALRVGNRFVPADRYRSVAFFAAGRAANSMALAALHSLGDRLTQGFIAAPEEPPKELPFRSALVAPGLPVSSMASEAAQAALELKESAGPGDLFLVLLSAGAVTALATAPETYGREPWNEWLQRLLDRGVSGADFLRVVRVLGSGAVGGKLLAPPRNADVATLLIERGDGPILLGGGPSIEVIDDERRVIRSLLERLELLPTLPPGVRSRLEPGSSPPVGSSRGVDRPVVVAEPADALRGAADALFDRKWSTRLTGLGLSGTPEEVADLFLGKAEEIIRGEPRADRALKGVGTFSTTTLDVPEGMDEGPAMSRFLRRSFERLRRREMTVGLLRTGGRVGEDRYPAGAVVGPRGEAKAPAKSSARSLAMRMGITDVGLLAIAMAPTSGAPARS